MSTETLLQVPVNNDAKAIALVKKFNISQAAVGIKFWVTKMQKKINTPAVLYLSKDENDPKPYLRVNIAGTEYNVNLGLHYDTMGTFEGLTRQGIQLDCTIAPRVPNPLLTDVQIESTRKAYGDKAVANILSAKENPDSIKGQFVLVSYVEPEM